MSRYYKTTRARSTGTLVTVCHGDVEGLDTTDDGPWYTICEHGGLCSHTSARLARSWASAPEEWCWVCQEAAALKLHDRMLADYFLDSDPGDGPTSTSQPREVNP